MPVTNFNWTDERACEELRSLWDQKFSAAQCARGLMSLFGGYLTRNAVLGKVDRMGLPTHAKPEQPTQPRKRKSRASGDKPLPKTPSWRKPKTSERLSLLQSQFEEAAEATDLSPDESPFACTLMNLKEDSCRWPMGNPQSKEFRFCGDVREMGGPYCTRHCEIAYRPVADRRRAA